MLICPLFFSTSSKETAHNLDSRKFVKPARGKDNSWCAPGNIFSWYEVAGLTLLHEMTHLDVVGRGAGVPLNGGTHGTEDVDGLGSEYQPAARKLLQIWQKKQNVAGTLQPWQNAENLAASALGKLPP
jgi:hypothetical protein